MAASDHWRVSNLSWAEPLAVCDAEQDASRIHLDPGRIEVTVPFELSTVESRGQVLLAVFGAEPIGPPTAAEIAERTCSGGARLIAGAVEAHLAYLVIFPPSAARIAEPGVLICGR